MTPALLLVLSLPGIAAGLQDADVPLWPRAVSNATVLSPISTPAVTGTGTAGIHASHNCSWSWSSWLDKSFDHKGSMGFQNITTTYTYHNVTASTIVGCDNITRIIGDLTTIGTGTNVSVSISYTNLSPTPFSDPRPTCTPTPEDCQGFRFMFDQNPCSVITTDRVKACGRCSIYGGTVDLLYFPTPVTSSYQLCPNATTSPGSATFCPLGPTTATRNATNPYDYQPCYYASPSPQTPNSGPYTVSAGHTFYENRAYISMDTAYARDQCGFIGKNHTSTILEIRSDEVFSVGGYHHEFVDAGYSFNFDDLENPAGPASYAYYMPCADGGGMVCTYIGTAYTAGRDFINGRNDVTFGNDIVGNTPWIWQQAYAPILLLPTQMKTMDEAWHTCDLNLGGLYDPPKALQQAAEATPAAPTPDGGPTTSAEPGNNPGTTVPQPTADPTTNGGAGSQLDDGTTSDGSDGNDQQPTQDGQASGDDPAATPLPDTDESDDDGDSNSGGDGDSANDGDGADPQQPQQTVDPSGPNEQQDLSTTMNIGDAVASILGMTRPPASPANPESQAGDGVANDGGALPAPVTFTGDEATHTAVPVAGSSGMYVVDGSRTVSDVGSTLSFDGFNVPVASNSVVDADTAGAEATPSAMTLTGESGAHTVIPISGESGVYVLDGSRTISASGGALTTDGITMSVGPAGVVDASANGTTVEPGATSASGSGDSSSTTPSAAAQTGNLASESTTRDKLLIFSMFGMVLIAIVR